MPIFTIITKEQKEEIEKAKLKAKEVNKEEIFTRKYLQKRDEFIFFRLISSRCISFERTFHSCFICEHFYFNHKENFGMCLMPNCAKRCYAFTDTPIFVSFSIKEEIKERVFNLEKFFDKNYKTHTCKDSKFWKDVELSFKNLTKRGY